VNKKEELFNQFIYMTCPNKLIQRNESDLQKNVTNPAMLCRTTLPLSGKGRSLLEKATLS